MNLEELLAETNRKLDVVVRLLAYKTVEQKTLTEGAPLLRRIGLTPSEIAAVYDTTANTVQVRVSQAKSKAKGTAKKSRAKNGQ